MGGVVWCARGEGNADALAGGGLIRRTLWRMIFWTGGDEGDVSIESRGRFSGGGVMRGMTSWRGDDEGDVEDDSLEGA